jgi:hypothetical protein
MLPSNLVARVVSGLSSIQAKRTTKVLVILAAIFMVMTGGEPAYAEWCLRC